MKKLLVIALIICIFNTLAFTQKGKNFSEAKKLSDIYRPKIEKLLSKGKIAEAKNSFESITTKDALIESEYFELKGLLSLAEKDFSKADENYQLAFDKQRETIKMFMADCRFPEDSMLAEQLNPALDNDKLFSPKATVILYENIVRTNQRRQKEYDNFGLTKYLYPLNLNGFEELKKLREDVLLCSAKTYLQKDYTPILDEKPLELALEYAELVMKSSPIRLKAVEIRDEANCRLKEKNF